jgi:hypothetical protein
MRSLDQLPVAVRWAESKIAMPLPSDFVIQDQVGQFFFTRYPAYGVVRVVGFKGKATVLVESVPILRGEGGHRVNTSWLATHHPFVGRPIRKQTAQTAKLKALRVNWIPNGTHDREHWVFPGMSLGKKNHRFYHLPTSRIMNDDLK